MARCTFQIENFLTPAEVKSITELASQAAFVEGKRSNPHNVTKDSEIGDPNDAVVAAGIANRPRGPSAQRGGSGLRIPAARGHPVAMPLLRRSKIRSAHGCGFHAGGAAAVAFGRVVHHVHQWPGRVSGWRTGGSCRQRNAAASKAIPGSAVFYPSTTVHQVAPVVSGTRLVMITFIESHISRSASTGHAVCAQRSACAGGVEDGIGAIEPSSITSSRTCIACGAK